MAKKIAGIAYVKVDGAQYALRGNLVVSPDGTEVESVVGQDGYHGTKETPVAPFIEGDFSDDKDVSLEKLRNLRDVTVTAELANGKVYVLRNASRVGKTELQTSEGMFKLRFEGPKCEEVR